MRPQAYVSVDSNTIDGLLMLANAATADPLNVHERRNSTIRFERQGDRTVVHKHYHARYGVDEEVASYERLAKLLQKFSGLRVPRVYEVNSSQNSMSLEFIAGPHLTDLYRNAGPRVFDQTREQLVSLFVYASEEKVRFDCTPEHFLVDRDAGGFVIIDPVCDDIDLDDFAAVVFLLGMIKCYLRHRPWRWTLSFMSSWKRYYRSYVEQSRGTRHAFNQQVSRYIDRVVLWNQQTYDDSLRVRATRNFAIIPFWRVMRAFFRWNFTP